MSGGYAPVAAPTYMSQQQGYYAQQYAPQPAVTPPAPPANGPSARRLPIKDPSTGLVIPVVTSVQVEQAVADYHRNSQVCTLAAHPLCMWGGKQAQHGTLDAVPVICASHPSRLDMTAEYC